MTIVIVCHLNTNGYITKTCKGTGRNGRRKNIGTGEVSKAAEGKATMTAGGVVITTAKDEMNKKVGINRTKEEL
jgi:hypothetical protein